MSIFMETITELLNNIIPVGSGLTVELSSLNELLAYFITLSILWNFFLKPVLRLFRIVK
jgi:hypothetical protein